MAFPRLKQKMPALECSMGPLDEVHHRAIPLRVGVGETVEAEETVRVLYPGVERLVLRAETEAEEIALV